MGLLPGRSLRSLDQFHEPIEVKCNAHGPLARVENCNTFEWRDRIEPSDRSSYVPPKSVLITAQAASWNHTKSPRIRSRKNSGIQFVKVMRKNQARTLAITRIGKATSIVLTLSALAALVGCQGLSQSSSNSSQASGNLVLGSASLDFGNVTPNTSKSMTLNATNSGNQTVNITSASFSTKYFALTAPTLPVALSAGQSTSLSISFTPNAAAAFNATLSIVSDASNGTQTVALSGTGTGLLAVSPTSEAFGNVNVGASTSQTVTLTNGGSSSVSVSQVSVNNSVFSISGINTPVSLNASQSTTFTVTFAPTSSGSASGTVTVTSNAPNPSLTMNVSGTGVSNTTGQLSVSPGTLALGNVTDGSSGTATGTLTASGASVTVTAASTNNSVFTIGGFSLPQTIPAGQSASFTITFSPTVAGSASATLSFTSNAQPPTTTETLTGTGVAASTHSVALSWTASTSQNISGYNVYRSPYTTSTSSCGTYTKINSVLDTSTLYTDSSVTNGNAYCYATTAVNTSSEESGYSNIVSDVQIPAQ